MNKQRKVLITTTYNEMGIIIDTKAEEVAQSNLQPTCNQLATDTISRQAAIDALCGVCGVDCDKSKFVYNAPQDEQVIMCPEHYALSTLPSEQPEWIPVMDGDGVLPEVDEDGYSDFVLVSFSNVSGLDIGQYREDENGGAFYSGDDDDPYTKIGVFVNAWMPLPKPYREGDTT